MPRKTQVITRKVAANIQRLRKDRGLTLHELGRRVGVAEATESYRERGQRKIPIDDLSLYARALSVPIDELMDEPAKMTGDTD